MGLVEVTQADGVAEVRLNRPARKNALSLEMFDAVVDAGEGLKAADGLRAVLLCGAGGDFCAGLDLEALQGLAGRIGEMRARLAEAGPDGANRFQRPATVWGELDVPVIAAIDGACLGGGLQLALGADIRICAPGARLGLLEAKWGMIPDMGVSQALPRLMAADRAKELMMTARIVSGAEAAALGLVTRLADDPLAAARALAGEIAARSPEAVAGVKRLVDTVWSLPRGAGLRVEAEIQAPLLGGANQVEAVRAGLARRAPRFR